MKPAFLLILASAAMAISSCKPHPIDIEIPQSATEITISSATPDARTLYVSAGYSISSMQRLIDTATIADYRALPKDMMIDSARVVLISDGGGTDTLKPLGGGLYGRRDLDLQPYNGYTLVVEDLRRGTRATARTTFMPKLQLDTMRVIRSIRDGDTVNKLHLEFRGVQRGERLLVCYNTSSSLHLSKRKLNRDLSALYDFQPTRMELLTVPDTVRNGYAVDLTLQVKQRDSVLVQVSRMDPPLAVYLNAYKRSGSLFSQLSGEPINLPGNILKGFGYFSMYLSSSAIFDLNTL